MSLVRSQTIHISSSPRTKSGTKSRTKSRTRSFTTSLTKSKSVKRTHERSNAYDPTKAERVTKICSKLDDTGLGQLRVLGLQTGLQRAQHMSKQRLCYHLLRGSIPALHKFKVRGGVVGAVVGGSAAWLLLSLSGPVGLTAGLTSAAVAAVTSVAGWKFGKKYFSYRGRRYMFLKDSMLKSLYDHKEPTHQTKARQQQHQQDVLVRRLRHGDFFFEHGHPWVF